MHYGNDLGFAVFAFLKRTHWTNTYTDLPCARRTLAKVDNYR